MLITPAAAPHYLPHLGAAFPLDIVGQQPHQHTALLHTDTQTAQETPPVRPPYYIHRQRAPLRTAIAFELDYSVFVALEILPAPDNLEWVGQLLRLFEVFHAVLIRTHTVIPHPRRQGGIVPNHFVIGRYRLRLAVPNGGQCLQIAAFALNQLQTAVTLAAALIALGCALAAVCRVVFACFVSVVSVVAHFQVASIVSGSL